MIVIASLSTSATVRAAEPAVIPRPAELMSAGGTWRVPSAVPIRYAPHEPQIRFLAEALAKELAAASPQVGAAAEGDALDGKLLIRVGADAADLGPEGYTLLVANHGVLLTARTPAGAFYGVQTLRQLLSRTAEGAVEIQRAHVQDQPRYRWRGLLLDCCRHYMDKEFVKRYIDLLAYHKLNTLHWHLTEDQGWRVEIKQYPRLTEIGAWRGAGAERRGGFYSQDDIREIVAYAARRHVTIVPEIEAPGHCQAALAAYPELSCSGGPFEVSTRWGVHKDVYCAGNERVFEFLENVLAEVVELFPSEYIHVGGDECPKERWQACEKCQARIRSEGLKDEDELQSYFIRRLEKLLNARGRRLIGWDEILEGGLAPRATVQSWRGMNGAIAAARAGHDVICSPTQHCYLDYPQAPTEDNHGWMKLTTLEQAYAFEPTPPELDAAQARHVLGIEACMWTEHAPQERVDWQVFPRLCALAEAAWSPKKRDWPDFQRRMQAHDARLDALGVRYFKPAAGGP